MLCFWKFAIKVKQEEVDRVLPLTTDSLGLHVTEIKKLKSANSVCDMIYGTTLSVYANLFTEQTRDAAIIRFILAQTCLLCAQVYNSAGRQTPIYS